MRGTVSSPAYAALGTCWDTLWSTVVDCVRVLCTVCVSDMCWYYCRLCACTVYCARVRQCVPTVVPTHVSRLDFVFAVGLISCSHTIASSRRARESDRAGLQVPGAAGPVAHAARAEHLQRSAAISAAVSPFRLPFRRPFRRPFRQPPAGQNPLGCAATFCRECSCRAWLVQAVATKECRSTECCVAEGAARTAQRSTHRGRSTKETTDPI